MSATLRLYGNGHEPSAKTRLATLNLLYFVNTTNKDLGHRHSDAGDGGKSRGITRGGCNGRTDRDVNATQRYSPRRVSLSWKTRSTASMLRGRCVKASTNEYGILSGQFRRRCWAPRTSASKPISTRKRWRSRRSLRRNFAPPRSRCLNTTWRSRKNSGTSLSRQRRSLESNASGSGSSSCRSATPSSQYATI